MENINTIETDLARPLSSSVQNSRFSNQPVSRISIVTES